MIQALFRKKLYIPKTKSNCKKAQNDEMNNSIYVYDDNPDAR